LFYPELIGMEDLGAHELVHEGIQRADVDLRKHLYSNIVLSGGSTLFKGTCFPITLFSEVLNNLRSGYGDRLLNELQKACERNTKLKIFAPPERKYSTWIGGSILASLSTFKVLLSRFLPNVKLNMVS
jgi:centractin